MARIFYLQVIFVVITVMVSGQGDVHRRCGPTGEYGENCAFVPAPPGRTPACAAPGLTYCEQLDHYPKDLIRHLVDKKQFDLSTLLNDETRDDFGATRPPQGPYGYGPNSLRGAQHISIVGQQPSGLGGQQPPPVPGPMLPGSGYLPGPDSDTFPSRGQFPNNQHFRGNPLPPPNGYVGYYTPSEQQRPLPQYFPSRHAYLPPPPSSQGKNPNSSLSWPSAHFPTDFSSGIHLDQYDDFWRGNSYFEVPKSFSDFHRNNVGPQLDYFDNNGGRPYYSVDRSSAEPYPAAGAEKAALHSGSRRRSAQRAPGTGGAALTPPPNHDWAQRYRHDNRRSDKSPLLPVDANDLKPKSYYKRDILSSATSRFTSISPTRATNTSSSRERYDNTTLNRDREADVGRGKRQAGGSGAGSGDGEQLCPTRSQYIMPRAALNKEGNWMYVVNMGDTDTTYSQLVKTEICVSQQCDGLCTLPLGYSSRCEQRYVQKRLVALEQGGQRLYTDVFWFPSCCLCTISNNQT